MLQLPAPVGIPTKAPALFNCGVEQGALHSESMAIVLKDAALYGTTEFDENVPTGLEVVVGKTTLGLRVPSALYGSPTVNIGAPFNALFASLFT